MNVQSRFKNPFIALVGAVLFCYGIVGWLGFAGNTSLAMAVDTCTQLGTVLSLVGIASIFVALYNNKGGDYTLMAVGMQLVLGAVTAVLGLVTLTTAINGHLTGNVELFVAVGIGLSLVLGALLFVPSFRWKKPAYEQLGR
ncbi:MAG: hypothetical protein JWL82_156 [Parcubacteria group bacterium]|nr:hypothetical protein [Parcubacteria group bacterium]